LFTDIKIIDRDHRTRERIRLAIEIQSGALIESVAVLSKYRPV